MQCSRNDSSLIYSHGHHNVSFHCSADSVVLLACLLYLFIFSFLNLLLDILSFILTVQSLTDLSSCCSVFFSLRSALLLLCFTSCSLCCRDASRLLPLSFLTHAFLMFFLTSGQRHLKRSAI